MGGRGGGSGGGGGAFLTNAQINQIAAKIAAQQQTPQPKQTVEEGMFSKFMSSTDDQKAAMIDTLRHEDVPAFLANNDFQRLTYSIGGDDKPTLVSDAKLKTMSGTEIYRTVNSVRDTKNGITYSADMIAAQVQKGSVTRVSDTGGSFYGRGIYFADNYRDSIAYGNVSGKVSSTAVIKGKITSSAKVVSYSKATSMLRAEINSGSKLGKAISKCDSASQVSIYAYSKGYDVIQSGTYMNVLSRKNIAVSDKVKAKGTSWK